jgi:hypothetical protein
MASTHHAADGDNEVERRARRARTTTACRSNFTHNEGFMIAGARWTISMADRESKIGDQYY